MKSNKSIYIAANFTVDGKHYASVIRTAEYRNLLVDIDVKNIVSADICPSKKKAEELAEFWNECYRKNGTYLFATMDNKSKNDYFIESFYGNLGGNENVKQSIA